MNNFWNKNIPLEKEQNEILCAFQSAEKFLHHKNVDHPRIHVPAQL